MNTYQVVDSRNHKVVATGFTHKEARRKGDKKAAKPVRDELNAGVKGHDPFIVSRGDDHPYGETNGISRQQVGRKSFII